MYLHNKSADDIRGALNRASKHIDTCLNLISGRLGLDHDQVFFGDFAVPVMVRYLDQRQQRQLGAMNEKECGKLLFWFIQAAMWGRFSGSTETIIDQDLESLENGDGGLDRLLEKLRLWHGGGLRAEPDHFTGSTLGARFYPVLYMMTRIGEAQDWGTGVPLKAGLRGKTNRLEVHHIFPKAQLRKAKGHNLRKNEINALGNYCFLTKETNLQIGAKLPEVYFLDVRARHPGALESQWIPDDPDLWKLDRFRDFLEARKSLLAAELNRQMEELLHGDTRWLAGDAAPIVKPKTVVGGIDSEDEEQELESLNEWVESEGLQRGVVAYDYADRDSGKQMAVFDLAWPSGLQENLGQPVAVLLNEEASTISLASQAGYRCFTSSDEFKSYVRREILEERRTDE